MQDLRLRLLSVVETRDAQAAEHLRRMSAVTGILAERVGLSPAEVWMLREAAGLHDVGKLTVSSGILRKAGPLDTAERAAIERHTITGHQILSGCQTPIFRLAAVIALSHHERWDGEGYPFGLRGEEIPFPGRIAAVADVFDALLSTRPYRAALDLGEATEIMRDGCASHFDPFVVDALLEDVPGAVRARSSAGDPERAFPGPLPAGVGAAGGRGRPQLVHLIHSR